MDPRKILSQDTVDGSRIPASDGWKPLIATTNVSCRFASIADIEKISSLAIETYKQTYRPALSYYTDDVLETLFGKTFRDEVLPKELRDAKYQYFICEADSKVVGYAKLEFKQDSAYLDKLYFLRDYQGKGYGQRMMQACLKSVEEHGFKKMTLDVWAANDKAISFYKRYGFKPGATTQFFLFGSPTPESNSNMEMTCDDITPYLHNKSSSALKH